MANFGTLDMDDSSIQVRHEPYDIAGNISREVLIMTIVWMKSKIGMLFAIKANRYRTTKKTKMKQKKVDFRGNYFWDFFCVCPAMDWANKREKK